MQSSIKLPRLYGSSFDWLSWRAGSIASFGIPCREAYILKSPGKDILKKHAVGWCPGEQLLCRPKENTIAIMFLKDEEFFWFHLRTKEFLELFGHE